MRTKDEDITGVASGFKTLDRVTNGWQSTDLIVLAARPSVGKTAFALNLARHAALHPTKPTPVGFFSLEMSAGQLVQRILSAESEITLEKISRGKLEDYEMKQLYTKGIDKLSKAPIFIDDSAALNIFEFRAKCRRLKSQYDIQMVIVDYLQLMHGKGEGQSGGGNREQEIGSISRALKSVAKELNVPVLALSQLSRAVEQREDKRPQLSDLRESGSIEQDADVVMFVYRDEYYEARKEPPIGTDKHMEWQQRMSKIMNQAEVIIAKQRHGPVGTVKLYFDGKFTRFGNLQT